MKPPPEEDGIIQHSINLISALVSGYFSLLILIFNFFSSWIIPSTKTKRRSPASHNGNAVIESKTPEKSIMTQIVRNTHCDELGICYGGQILAWMDIIAGTAARKHSGLLCVTASIDSVHFLNPVRQNQICIIKASVSRSWNTSMEVIVNVEVEDTKSGFVTFCCCGFFTFVTEKRHRVPLLIPNSLREKRRYHDVRLAQAAKRRESRIAEKKRSIIPVNPYHLEQDEKQFDQEAVRRLSSFTESKPRFHSSSINATLKIACSDTFTEVTEIIFPEHCNSLGITFGGTILKYMEFAAQISANRLCRTDILIVSIDSVSFLHPSRQGDILSIKAIVSSTFRHSIEVYCTVERISNTGDSIVTNDGWITLVSVGENGDPIPVPQIIPQSKLEKERHGFAIERKEKRLQDKSAIQEYLKNDEIF